MADTPRDWVSERTLGGRAVEFWWRVDELGNLLLRRVSAAGATHAARGRMVRRPELEQLLAWMADRGWVPLANLPYKLRAGTEADGIGRFLHRQLGWHAVDAVLGSHLVAVLTAAEVVAWDGKRRGMSFRLVADDLDRVRACYERRRAAAESAVAAGGERRKPPEPPMAHRAKPGGQEPPQFDLAARFRARSRELRARFEACEGGRHPVEIGGRRETVVRTFLRDELPQTYAVARGEFVAACGEASPQIDALIYDRAVPPLVPEADGTVLLAAECVHAAIEIKPTIGRSTLAEAVANARRIKTVPRTAVLRPQGHPPPRPCPPAFAGLFTFASIQPRRVHRLLAELEGDVSPNQGIDCVCMLDRGIVFRYPGLLAPMALPIGIEPPPGDGPRMPLVCIEARENTLLCFHLLLTQALAARPHAWPDLAAYAWGLGYPEPTLL